MRKWRANLEGTHNALFRHRKTARGRGLHRMISRRKKKG